MRPSLPETLRSFVFIDILASFPQNAAFTCQPHQADAAPDVWGLRCPEGPSLASHFNLIEPPFAGSQTSKSNVCASLATTPDPSSFEEGSCEFPSLGKEGLGVVDISDRPFVFIDILALFRRFSYCGRSYSHV